ncbi:MULTISPECIES: TetR/AcrR family transcriptional regulator [Prauserella salsuginis group]|uniref:TetR/AcrR family transcriptional regulator n=1 Tax=Prauserella salsuginis TaxID=387889 RepID=A0ABW6G841_9PSEU|nr:MULTISPECIES: TetR/AcrR family transcriptional regulator [Prauserella salsuginis group]MCR3721756.1 transcriptional regulator, TetR family [Prauserella flava]MCR3734447.1 transcriptional regulator, TetR family [Prauserella salsuginis]
MQMVGGGRTPRQRRVTDAAIEIIATDGLRGLTHRAVDMEAGLPAGSTSSCFRTRLALLGGVLDRLVELDEAVLEQLPTTGWDSRSIEHRERLVELLAELLTYWLGPARSRTRARLELYLDAARRPELADALHAANRRFLDRASAAMGASGVPVPEETARLLLAGLDGVLYDALARPFLGGDHPARLRRAVQAAVDGAVPRT